MKSYGLLILSLLFIFACQNTPTSKVQSQRQDTPFLWENATIYFALTDRFYNGDKANDLNFGRDLETGPLRGFEGGDLRGVIQKIDAGYFDSLGVNAIWLTPLVEQVHGFVDEGTGVTYGFHGYWAKDWTRLDPNFGTEEDYAEFVRKAHEHGIRVVMDVVVNHTGPVTDDDPVWPSNWVRTSPKCTFDSYGNTVNCTLVENLPDVLTGSNEEVDLPDQLVAKWKSEGRYDKELAELNAFFEKTGYPRAPRFYIYKWLCDFVRKYGIDGFRCDTAKHTEEDVWEELEKEAAKALAEWKKENPEEALDDAPFYMMGEVYGYRISSGRDFDFGDQTVDFFDHGFQSLINFDFTGDATKGYEAIFTKYDSLLQGPLKGKGVVNYLSSHDDSNPYDKDRFKPFEAGTKLLLCPGTVQLYYGDETARVLEAEGANGDANLRTAMNWDALDANNEQNGYKIQDVQKHFQKLGRFRREHLAVGAGKHQMLQEQPYIFSRILNSEDHPDAVVVGLDMGSGEKRLKVGKAFTEGTELKDYFSGQKALVKNGEVVINSGFGTVLLGQPVSDTQ